MEEKEKQVQGGGVEATERHYRGRKCGKGNKEEEARFIGLWWIPICFPLYSSEIKICNTV